jgi:hypothetical protein
MNTVNFKRKSKISKIILVAALVAWITIPSKAQMAVVDPTNLAQGIVNSAQQITEASSTTKNTAANFKETVKIYEQNKQYYDGLKSVNHLVKDARKVQKTVLLVGEISEIYVTNFQKIMEDKNFTEQEITAIGNGYAILMSEGGDLLAEVKEIITRNGLSMSDAERMEIIDRVYSKVKRYRDLVSYYTKKNISISFIRAKKTGDTQRVLALYGNADQKYW